MARARPDIDYEKTLLDLREDYVAATPGQRLHVIRLRLEDHHFGPNRLVTAVSAVEALARCLLIEREAKVKADRAKIYPKYKRCTPQTLGRAYLKNRGIADPGAFFEEDNWRLFGYAVEYRHLLVHECTYLGQDKFPSLIAACTAILEKLVNLGGVSEKPAGPRSSA
jgi:hypothetical protein